MLSYLYLSRVPAQSIKRMIVSAHPNINSEGVSVIFKGSFQSRTQHTQKRDTVGEGWSFVETTGSGRI